jgi:hypothetical protein
LLRPLALLVGALLLLLFTTRGHFEATAAPDGAVASTFSLEIEPTQYFPAQFPNRGIDGVDEPAGGVPTF